MNCFEKIDDLFSQWDTTKSPGCALALVQDGEIIFENGYGIATLEHHIPIRPTTAFYIASTSKQFAAFSIALLEEAGKLSVQDDVRKYIPELPDYGTPIQIQHMIHHTSGLRDFLELNALSGRYSDELITPEDALTIISRQKQLNFKPGDRYLYCNSGYFLLSVIVKRVTGKNLRQFAEENIFGPLGMKHTHFHNDRTEPVLNRAIGYSFTPEKGYRINIPGLETVGSGGIYSTVQDLALWDKNFYTNRLGKGRSDLMERILIPGVLNSGVALDYAFGLTVQDYRGLKKVGHSGGYGGYSAEFIRFPEKNFTVICFSNNSTLSAPGLALKVADLYLADHLAPPKAVQTDFQPVVVGEANIEGKEGYYLAETGETIIKIVRQDDQLVLDMSEMQFPLLPVAQNQFLLTKAPFTALIEFDRDGTKQIARVDRQGNKPPETLTKFVQQDLPATELEVFCGDYFSDELNSTALVSLADGKLHLRIGHHHTILFPGTQGKFIIEGGDLDRALLEAFIEDGNVKYLTLNAGRVKNIIYTKK